MIRCSRTGFINFFKPSVMNKKFALTSFVALFFLLTTSNAQLRPIPTAVTNAFSKQYPGATEVKYSDQLSGVYVTFLHNGEKMVASYSNKGVWKETTKESNFEQLPEEVKNGFQKSRFADRTIDETKRALRRVRELKCLCRDECRNLFFMCSLRRPTGSGPSAAGSSSVAARLSTAMATLSQRPASMMRSC